MQKNILIGKTEFGKVPRIAAIIDRMLPLQAIRRLKSQGADLLEVRVDLFKEPVQRVLEYVSKVKKESGLPLLGTVRETSSNKKKRLEIFHHLIPIVDCIDIEVDAPIKNQVIKMTRNAKKKVIVSEHDFKKTPDNKRLIAIAKESLRSGADMVKIAAMAKTNGDVVRLLQFCADCQCPMIAISMGEYGKISRVLAPLYGALFTYGFIGAKAVAPGQLALDKLDEMLGRLYPARRR
jgi:3-dehydroquinate dehydratase I